MMPITPKGTDTREIFKPLGRVHSASVRPTGSGCAAIDQQSFRRTTDAGAPHLGIEHDRARFLGIGLGMDIGVAEPVQMLQHRNAALGGDAFDETTAAAWDDEVDAIVHAEHDADRLAIGGRDVYDCSVREADRFEGASHHGDDDSR